MSEQTKDTEKVVVGIKDSNRGILKGLFQKVYNASDSRGFLTEEERDVHEAELRASYFYLVRFDPDLEDSGHSRKQACIQIIGAKDLREAELFLRYQLYNLLGNELIVSDNSKLVFSWSYEWASLPTYVETLCGIHLRSKSYTGIIRGLKMEKSFID